MKSQLASLFVFASLLTGTFARADLVDFDLILNCARQSGIVAPSEATSCFAVGEDGSLYEMHNRRCGGDPHTQPTRAFFSVRRINHSASLGYEYAGADWVKCQYR